MNGGGNEGCYAVTAQVLNVLIFLIDHGVYCHYDHASEKVSTLLNILKKIVGTSYNGTGHGQKIMLKVKIL